METFSADLHIHTCLSPCADLDMTPMKIVEQAVKKGLSMIAITDHNSLENTGAVIRAARGTGLTVLAGVEITSVEEAHVLGLFEKKDSVDSMQTLLDDNILPGENDEDLFGIQVVANEKDEVERINNRLLIGATQLSLDQIVAEIHKRQGLAIAAHIDRMSFSIPSQLGFIPPALLLDGLEISKHTPLSEAKEQIPECNRFPVITSSDAHFLDEIGQSRFRFEAEQADFKEFQSVLAGKNGRRLID
jgi:predicted metal-dependent phosphoesterase TrpH